MKICFVINTNFVQFAQVIFDFRFTVSSLPDIPRLPHLSPPPPPPIVKNTVDSEYDICKEHFMAAFPGIVKDLTDNKPYDLPYVTEWIEKVIIFETAIPFYNETDIPTIIIVFAF